ncbi:TPA: hypothetical protein QB648_002075 [Pasteurella multocida]|nr:hypothetical protein [Pasteurella multocida]
MNILKIYQNNPDTVFVARNGVRLKVHTHDSSDTRHPFKMVMLSGEADYWVTNEGNTSSISDFDVVDYEQPQQPQVFSVGEYVTRDGRKAVIYHDLSERFKMCYPLFGYIDGNEDYDTWTKCGEGVMGEAMPYDLVGPWVEPQRTITVNGKEFYPVKNPKDGKRHFYVSVATQTVAHSTTWNVKNPNILDAMLVNLNLVYRTREEAQAFLAEIIKPNAEVKYASN